MEKYIHSIRVNLFEKHQENIDDRFSKLRKLLPVDFKKEKIQIKHEKLEGFHNKIIHSLTLETTKKRHNRMLIKSILNNLSYTDIKKLKKQIESRLNDDGFFFIRLDKQSFLNESYKLTEKGDCIHIKIKLAAFPAKRPCFMKSIEKILNMYDDNIKEEN